ncbi:MAG: discoidin domain-containing protein [bacterium]
MSMHLEHRAIFFVAGLTTLFLTSCQTPTPSTGETPAAPMVEPPAKTQWTASASDVQEPIFPAGYAIDGRSDTRWSSPALDPQWLMVDMGGTGTLCGLNIAWETAFSSEYEIYASLDGDRWTRVYRTSKGDGHTDVITFAPTLARFFKIVGLKRGTGWGHSIWEINTRGPSDIIQATAPTRDGSEIGFLFDGSLDTTWVAAAGGATQIDIDLRKPTEFGGLRIDWGAHHATELEVLASSDRQTWRTVTEIKSGTGNFDLLLHPRTEARYLRLNVKATVDNAPVEIRDLSLKGPDEMPTPNTLYEIATEKARPGLYPEQFRKRQAYWTIMGLPVDHQESLLDEYGNFEPTSGSCSVYPFVYLDGKLHSALDARGLAQSLEKGFMPMPGVTWDLGNVQLYIQGYTRGTPSDSVSYVRYTVTNTSDVAQKGRLFLAIRPVQVNPIWQYGGLSPIQSMELTNTDEGATVRVNHSDKFISLTPPSAFGARAFDLGDVVKDLENGVLPPDQTVSNAGDLISGALAYDFDLAPGETAGAILAAPLHGRKDNIIAFQQMSFVENVDPNRALQNAFETRLEDMRNYWDGQINAVTIDIPDRDIANAIKSQIGYILINIDGIAIQPGSRNYNRSWIRDGGITSVAMLRMGVTEPVRKFLGWYAARVLKDGLVPPILDNNGSINTGFGSNIEYDSQGEFIYAVMEYYYFTKDRAFLEEHFDEIKRAMEFMVVLRDRTLAPDYMAGEDARERFIGILPASISHEGYSPPVHSYWDDFWALKGWKEGKAAAEVLGSNDIARWADDQYRIFKDSMRKSLEATIAYKGISYIPGCAEKGDMDATSTAIGISPCQELDVMPRAALDHTYDMFYKELKYRLEPGWNGTLTPYELRSVTAFVALGHNDRAITLLDFMMSCRRPLGWNHLAEVVIGETRKGGYIGDMPHTWVGSGLVNAVREMLADEQNGKLVLLAGAPERWFRNGAGIRIANLPTHFGKLDMTAKLNDNVLTITLNGSIDAPKGFDLRWPIAGKPASVTVDGTLWPSFDETSCRVGNRVKEIVATW